MHRKGSILLVICGLVVLLATYYFIVHDSSSDIADLDPHSGINRISDDASQEPSDANRSDPEAETSGANANSPSTVEISSSTPRLEELTAQDLASDFLQADSALEADGLINAAEQIGIGVAKDWRLSLDTMCSPSELSYLEQNNGEGQSRFVEKVSDYCVGYQPKYDIVEKIQAGELQQILDDRYQVKQRDYLAEELGDLSGSPLGKRIKEFIREARFPEDITALGEYLQLYYEETGEVLWRPDAGAAQVQDMFISSLQATALDLYSCQRFGGCGPGSMKVIRVCAFSSSCKEGWNYEQYVFANHSPLQMEYIQRVLNHLYSI